MGNGKTDRLDKVGDVKQLRHRTCNMRKVNKLSERTYEKTGLTNRLRKKKVMIRGLDCNVTVTVTAGCDIKSKITHAFLAALYFIINMFYRHMTNWLTCQR